MYSEVLDRISIIRFVRRGHSQALLSAEQQQQIYEIGGQEVQEDDVDVVDEPTAADVAIRVPQHHLEGVVVHHCAPLVQHILERDALHGRGRDVVHRDLVRPATRNSVTPRLSRTVFRKESVFSGESDFMSAAIIQAASFRAVGFPGW